MTTPNQPAEIQKVPATLQEYLRQPEIIERFSGILGNEREAMKYIQSVIIAVTTSESEQLQKATPPSIARAALRAASLELSCDPAVKQAWIVPYNNTKTGKVEANFQPHYNGLYVLAMRTGKYSVINVSPVYEGSEVLEDIYTGLHVIRLNNGLDTAPEQVTRLRSVNASRGKVIGWLGYYRTTRGAEKTVYMSVEDIAKHVAKYNQYWEKSKAWRNERETMEKKTVLRALLRTADLTGTAHDKLKAAMEDQPIDAEYEDLPEEVTPNETEQEYIEQASAEDIIDELGY
jgi:recombination protein RecT